ncbi:MAG: 50S ribosomal protein L21 [Acidimicrobiia bacterium]
MYAVIKTGGRQAKVREGDVLDVQRLRSDGEVTFEAILVVGDDGSILSGRDDLAKASVKAQVIGENRGKKVDVFHYRNKSGYRKSAGHRQTYTRVEITEISAPGLKAPAKKKPAAKKPATKPTAEKEAAAKPAPKKAPAKAPAKKAAAKAPAKPAAEAESKPKPKKKPPEAEDK